MSEEGQQAQRLQKYLSRCGVASRRASEKLIAEGRVQVNGAVVTELGSKVNPAEDAVRVDGRILRPLDGDVTIMLHKPAGYVSAMSDPQGRPCVSELIPVDRHPSLFHLGRLDRDTSGLLLFSTDGQLGNALVHPSREVGKVYYALVQNQPSEEALHALRNGVMVDGRLTAPAKASILSGDQLSHALACLGLDGKGASGRRQAHSGKSAYVARRDAKVLQVTIHEGRNRQVRKMCEAVGHPVIALHRQRFGPLDLGGLERGTWRYLSADEISCLNEAARGKEEEG